MSIDLGLKGKRALVTAGTVSSAIFRFIQSFVSGIYPATLCKWLSMAAKPRLMVHCTGSVATHIFIGDRRPESFSNFFRLVNCINYFRAN